MKRKNLMKGIILPCLCLFLMTACSNNADANDNTNANSKGNNGWQVAKEVPITHKANKIAFYNLDYGITVGYSGEIHYTTDQGQTWPRAENDSHCQFGAEIVNDKVAYSVGNHKHLVKTVDGGKTWSRITDFGGTNPNQCQMVSFINENIGMIASQIQLAFTKDGGNTWVEQTPPSKIMSIYMVNETDAYVVGLDKKLYVTNDTGATWKNIDVTIEGFEDETAFSGPQSCTLTISEDGKGKFFYLVRGGILRCFETTDGFATVSKTQELNFSDKMESSNKLYLSRDGKYITLQSTMCDKALVLTYAE